MIKYEVPIWEKLTLTIDEAAAYSNIGVNKIRKMTEEPKCPFIVFVGNKKLIKRKEFEKYVNSKLSL
ncbi:MAG: excisionase [Eubacteriales bacterium]|nr:excisionase [Eubacteriales bacterium]